MNENTLILTEHRLAPRLFDAALTLIAWGGFLFFLYARLWMQLTEEGDHRWSVIIASFNTVLVYLLIAAFNGWLLILWYQYNRRRAHVRVPFVIGKVVRIYVMLLKYCMKRGKKSALL